MVTPLLQTKLYISPTRPELVPRPRLIERLNAGLRAGRRLTLISAPVGFGKTTLVGEWVEKLEIGAAWLSLDKGDNDLVRFLVYFIAALQTLALSQVEGKVNVGKGAMSALQSPQPPPTEAVLTSLINEIAALSGRIVLVLDDYHLIETRSIHDALAFLLEHLPPQLHLVIATREDPHLPLARLRARGQLTELRAADLRFSASEAAEFLNQVMDLDLSTQDVAALEARTEGWIAGLQLAALALQGTIAMRGRKDATGFIKSFTGSHHFVLDYLIEEVLEQQPASVQTFLLQTAVLDQLTGSLCDALTGQGNGQATLEMLQHANLFLVPLDEELRWYRYHHLFSDLLRQRLRQTQPEVILELHQRASEWYEQNGFNDAAIGHALRAEDFQQAAHLVEEQVDAAWQRGEHTKLRRWLAGLPVELVLSRPQLCIFNAWYLFAGGQLDAAEQSLQAAKGALEPGDESSAATAPRERDLLTEPGKKLRGRLAAIQAFMGSYRGDLPGIIQHATQALEYLPQQDSWRGPAAMALGDAWALIGDMTAMTEKQPIMTKAQKLTLDRPATYQIQVPGRLDESWSDWVEGLAITVESEGDGLPITTLTGDMDQAALQGLLRRLYSLSLPLISVNLVECGSKERR
jgi:LuxR family maltose regulon positive regulatory protein